jgi:hypothetical protein
MIEDAYYTHRILAHFLAIAHLSGELADPDVEADRVERLMNGNSLRDWAHQPMNDDELEAFEVTLAGAVAILDAMIWNVAGKERAFPARLKDQVVSMFMNWRSTAMRHLGYAQPHQGAQPIPRTLAEAGDDLRTALAKIHAVLHLKRPRSLWVQDVIQSAFGSDLRQSARPRDLGSWRQMRMVSAATQLCHATLPRLAVAQA